MAWRQFLGQKAKKRNPKKLDGLAEWRQRSEFGEVWEAQNDWTDDCRRGRDTWSKSLEDRGVLWSFSLNSDLSVYEWKFHNTWEVNTEKQQTE